MDEKTYKIREIESKQFVDAINKKDYLNAYNIFKDNSPLTFALPIRYINKGYWGILQNVGEKEANKFLDSCERALNKGEENKYLRQLKLEKIVLGERK